MSITLEQLEENMPKVEAEIYRFGPYTLRMATPADRELCAEWIARDDWHKEKMDAEFFLKEEPGVGCYVLEDHEGAILFFRTENTVRLHMQFDGRFDSAARERNREALLTGMDWLAMQLAAKSIVEMTFDSDNPLLRLSACKRLGFHTAPGDLRRGLAAERERIEKEKARRTTPHEE